MRKTTKAEKIAAYDELVAYKGAADLLHFLMAFRERDYDAEHAYDSGTCDQFQRAEKAHVRVQGWGLGRGDGGCVLVTSWTTDRDGDTVGEHVVFAGYLSHMPDGGERYYLTPMGQALHAARRAARSAQHAAIVGAA